MAKDISNMFESWLIFLLLLLLLLHRSKDDRRKAGQWAILYNPWDVHSWPSSHVQQLQVSHQTPLHSLCTALLCSLGSQSSQHTCTIRPICARSPARHLASLCPLFLSFLSLFIFLFFLSLLSFLSFSFLSFLFSLFFSLFLFSLSMHLSDESNLIYQRASPHIISDKHTIRYLMTTAISTISHILHYTHTTLHTTHYTLHTTHYTLHTTHYTLHTTHYTLHTTHYTLHTSYIYHFLQTHTYYHTTERVCMCLCLLCVRERERAEKRGMG